MDRTIRSSRPSRKRISPSNGDNTSVVYLGVVELWWDVLLGYGEFVGDPFIEEVLSGVVASREPNHKLPVHFFLVYQVKPKPSSVLNLDEF